MAIDDTIACARRIDLASFNRDGFIVVPHLFSSAEMDLVRDTFMAQVKDGPIPGLSEIRDTYAADDPLNRWPRLMFPHLHSDKPVGPVAKSFMLDRRLHAILRELMNEEPLAVQSMFYFKPPGARGQDLHQDNFYLRVKPGTCMAAWLAVDDADEENGGMICVPETAAMPIVCPEPSDKSRFFTEHHVEPPPGRAPVAVNLKAGDVLFFNGSVIHGSHPNTSADRFRRALICHYVPESTAELSSWYEFPISFDGRPRKIPAATGGGPCGTVQAELH